MRSEAEVAVIVLRDRSGRILMQHRTLDAPRQPNKWTPPGGGVEPGETPLAAAHRELEEETGLTVADLSPYRAVDRPLTDGRMARWHVFVGETDATQADVVLGEGQAMVFLTEEEIAGVELTPFAAGILPEFF